MIDIQLRQQIYKYANYLYALGYRKNPMIVTQLRNEQLFQQYISLRQSDEDIHFAAHIETVFSLGCRLFSLNMRRTENTSFGNSYSLLQLRHRHDSSQRFFTLLECSADSLEYHLSPIVTLMAQHNVGIDWARLMIELCDWDDPQRRIQSAWVRDYYRSLNAAQETARTDEQERPVLQESLS